MRLLRSKPRNNRQQEVTVKPPITARFHALRGTAQHYRAALTGLRSYWNLVIPFLLWQGYSAYKDELRRQHKKLQQRSAGKGKR